MPRLVILGSARSGSALLESILAQLREQRHLLELRLVPLTEGETRELIALRMNCQPEELADNLVGRVHSLCGGNPFFIAETVRDWFDKQAIARNEAGWVLFDPGDGLQRPARDGPRRDAAAAPGAADEGGSRCSARPP